MARVGLNACRQQHPATPSERNARTQTRRRSINTPSSRGPTSLDTDPRERGDSGGVANEGGNLRARGSMVLEKTREDAAPM